MPSSFSELLVKLKPGTDQTVSSLALCGLMPWALRLSHPDCLEASSAGKIMSKNTWLVSSSSVVLQSSRRI